MNSNWKGSSQTNSIFTWHDLISKSPEKLHQKIPRHQKHFQQSSRIKNHFTILALLYTKNEQIEKEYGKIVPFTVASRKWNSEEQT
jgi:hypothetical protein